MNKSINTALVIFLIISLALNFALALELREVAKLREEYKEHIEIVKKRSAIVNEENFALHTAMKDFLNYTMERDAEIINLREENKVILFQLEVELAKRPTKWF